MLPLAVRSDLDRRTFSPGGLEVGGAGFRPVEDRHVHLAPIEGIHQAGVDRVPRLVEADDARSTKGNGADSAWVTFQ